MTPKIKLTVVTLILLIALLACALPGQVSSNKQLDQNLLATSVAQTIEADNRPEANSPGTQAPAPENASPEAAFTSIPTLTASSTADPTITTTPTLSPGDPTIGLGQPDFKDAFNTDTNWALFDSASSKTEIKNGQFYYTIKTASAYSDEWTFSWPQIKDFYLEVTAISPASCSGKDRFGLIFKAPSYSEGYLFYIACDGSYRLSKWDGAHMIGLTEWTFASEIDAGPNQANRIGVKTQDNDISLYINGHLVKVLEDNSYLDAGYFGFVLSASETNNFTVIFDNIVYWE